MSPEEEKQRGLTRERLVEAALRLVNEEGLDGLSMRALAEKLDVKAASLYWHVRDRRELLELLAEGILQGIRRPRRGGGWRVSRRGRSPGIWDGRGSGWRSGRRAMTRSIRRGPRVARGRRSGW